MAQHRHAHFVNDGGRRAGHALIAQIRAEVELEYAQQLQSANWLRRWLLTGEIRREVSRRLGTDERFEKRVSPRNLYFVRGS